MSEMALRALAVPSPLGKGRGGEGRRASGFPRGSTRAGGRAKPRHDCRELVILASAVVAMEDSLLAANGNQGSPGAQL
jgi:hypothetical protein